MSEPEQTQNKENSQKTLVDCMEDEHIQRYHAGKGMGALLTGLHRSNVPQMRMGAIILAEVHKEIAKKD